MHIINGALEKQKSSGMECPIMVSPRCHPGANWLVHVDGRKRLVYLSCARCDRLITTVRAGREIGTA